MQEIGEENFAVLEKLRISRREDHLKVGFKLRIAGPVAKSVRPDIADCFIYPLKVTCLHVYCLLPYFICILLGFVCLIHIT